MGQVLVGGGGVVSAGGRTTSIWHFSFHRMLSHEPVVLSAWSGWILKPIVCFQLQLALQGPHRFSLEGRN